LADKSGIKSTLPSLIKNGEGWFLWKRLPSVSTCGIWDKKIDYIIDGDNTLDPFFFIEDRYGDDIIF
jgi:hypothetical protein